MSIENETVSMDEMVISYLFMLIKIIVSLVIIEYGLDVIFHFTGKTNTANARISDLTSLVFALVFYISLTNFSSRIEFIKFRSDINDKK